LDFPAAPSEFDDGRPDQVIDGGSEEPDSPTVMHGLIKAGPIEVFYWIRVTSAIFRADGQGCQSDIWHGMSPVRKKALV